MNEREADEACAVLDEVIACAESYVKALRALDPFHPAAAIKELALLKRAHQRWMKIAGDDYPDGFEPEALHIALAAFEEGKKEYARGLRKLHGEVQKLSDLVADAVDALEAGHEKETIACMRSAEKVTLKWAEDTTAFDESTTDAFAELSADFAGEIEYIVSALDIEIKDWDELDIEYDGEGGMAENRRKRGR